MKILLMEKFDGISSQIPLLNGRDPRLNISQDYVAAYLTEADGLVYRPSLRTNSTNRLIINCTGITSLDPNGRYSFVFNGLRTLIAVTGTSSRNQPGLEERRFLGLQFDSRNVSRAVQTVPFTGITGDTRLEKFNLEMVYEAGIFKVYVNGLLKSTLPGSLNDQLLLIRVDSHHYYSSTGSDYIKYGGPIFELGEIIVVELEEGEKRVGNCRLERLPVKDTSENLQDPENVIPVNLANNTFSTVGQDEVDVSLELPTVDEHEKVIGVDFRISAVSTPNGSQMRVRLNDGDEDVHDTILHLPQVHTRASTCQVTPPQQVGDKPEDYSGYRLYISATEDGV